MAEGERKRLRRKPWTFWDRKTQHLSPGDIIRLPIDVRVHLLTRVDHLDILFQLGRQEPLMKAFMKKYDIFGKWFRYHCGLEKEEDSVDNIISDLSESFGVDDDGFVMIEWRDQNNNVENIELSCTATGLELWCTQTFDFLSEFDTVKNYTPGETNAILTTINEEPLVRFIKLSLYIDRRYRHMKRIRVNTPVVFNHRSPFDVLCLSRLSKWSDWQSQYEIDIDDDPTFVPTENTNIVRVLRHAGTPYEIYTFLVQGLSDEAIKVSEL